MSEDDYIKELEKIPLWKGYKCGFDRTACWCCPFQSKAQWDALGEYYPLLFGELKEMFQILEFKEHEGDGYLKRIQNYWGDFKKC